MVGRESVIEGGELGMGNGNRNGYRDVNCGWWVFFDFVWFGLVEFGFI